LNEHLSPSPPRDRVGERVNVHPGVGRNAVVIPTLPPLLVEHQFKVLVQAPQPCDLGVLSLALLLKVG
jgi:hypothetical protein